MGKYSNPSGLSCSFCHKPQREVDKIIAGPNVYICSECIRLCLDIIRENSGRQKPVSWGQSGVPVPAKIKTYLDQYVVGQDAAKRKLAVAVYNHYKRLEANARQEEGGVEVQKSNVLLIGPTGTGKTLLAQTLARFLDVPFVIADATTLTEAGYVGEDVENIVLNLYQSANNNIERTQRGIIYVDEIDKLTKKNFSSSVSRDVSGEGVQQALLKILEGTVANIQVKGNKRMPNQESVQIDTKNILFIVGGSFEGLERIIEQRIGRRSVGFDREEPIGGDDQTPDSIQRRRNLLQRVTTEDLDKFGLIPEFIGRLPVQAVMDPLSADDLVHVLTQPKNALIKQYQKLMKFEKTKLSFDEDAVRAIAEASMERKSGARGLRAIIEKVMLNVMFEVPSVEGLSEVVVTAASVRGEEEPRFVTAAESDAPA
ncbi:MAG: ATP-dependent Clp protease ATP-binding subunit ClpX [Alphaproteobacteria bacterium]|nr:ATP-dependent Clp protease ATP-binding subunit ClpX [Alphaproteobacteria bacterium]MCB9692508.1 ATP-dependent Clp protease ATP-binding subunit ClpX [Alphaproteobacteria bacterium]